MPRARLYYGYYSFDGMLDGGELIAFPSRSTRDPWVRTGRPSPTIHPDPLGRRAIPARDVPASENAPPVMCGDCRGNEACEVCATLRARGWR